MSSVIKHLLVVCCSLILLGSGCTYGPTPYSGGYYGNTPYGYPSGGVYPGGAYPYQSQPIQTLQPGQQYVPGGSVVPQGVMPGGVTPTYQNNGGGLTPIPYPNGASTDAPPHSSTEINKPVPEPSNPAGGPFYGTGNTTSTAPMFQPPIDARSIQPANHNEPLQAIGNTLRESNAATTVVGPTETYNPPPSALPAVSPMPMNNAIDINQPGIPSVPPASGGGDPFATPVPPPSQNEPQPAAMPIFGISNIRSNKPVPNGTSPFAYAKDYRWLRGVVSQDEPTGTWSVVYSDNPDQGDDYAGHLSLAESPYLEQLTEGDVVHVEGMVDPVLKDPLGKPFFLITKLRKITAAPVAKP